MSKTDSYHKQKHLTVEMKVSKCSLSHILCENLCLSAYTHCESFDAGLNGEKIGWKRFQKMHTHGILFTNKKISNIEEKFNRQNDHTYAKSCYEAKDKFPSF